MHAFITYFKDSWQEFGKVIWPSRAESLRLTGAVLALSAILGAYIAAVDYGLVELLRRVILGV